jgi:hypothetical protein
MSGRMGWQCSAIVALSLVTPRIQAQCSWVMSDFVKNKPVIADTVCEITSTTPWGTFTQTFAGRYWRSRDGSTREDTSWKTTHIFILDRMVVFIDHESKTATVQTFDHVHIWPIPLRLENNPGTTRTGILAGRPVIGKHMESFFGTGAGAEVWIAKDLQLLVDVNITAETFRQIQQVRNIEEREPDGALFKIPEGYSVVKCVNSPPPAGGPPLGPQSQCYQETAREKKSGQQKR